MTIPSCEKTFLASDDVQGIRDKWIRDGYGGDRGRKRKPGKCPLKKPGSIV
jgi:hypothetical protein